MKKATKRILSVLLMGLLLAAVFAGCGNAETGSSEKAGSSGVDSSSQSAATDASVQSGGEDEDEDDGELKEIEVALLSFSPMDGSQTDAVVEAINAVTEEKINVHANISWYDVNTYLTQVPMMIQANEKLDLIHYTPIPGAGYSAFQTQNQLLDITELLNQHAPGIVDMMGELLNATTVDDSIYGVACNRVLSSDLYIVMRKDVLDELGLTEKAENLSSWTEYEEILEAVKAAHPELSPVTNADVQGTVITSQPFDVGADSFLENFNYDQLGDSYNLAYCADDTIECYFFTDTYKQSIDRVRSWYEKDLVFKDASTNQDLGNIKMKNGAAFSYIQQGEIGFAETAASSTGYEVVCAQIAKGMIYTGACQKFGFAVPVTSTEPDAAVKFLNELYTNGDVVNTLAWGVEGRDWVEKDGVAVYPEGVTAENVLYHTADYSSGNIFVALPWDPADVNIRETEKEALETAARSKYMGFSVDSSPVEQEVTACFNVTQEYKASLASGSADVEAKYTEFCDKLKAAGVETVIAEYQKQLDEWLAAQ